ncbi:MAG: kinase [Selenomonadaceae bacterium]|nr:kinase [Selenomonadaceae bacterium]
MIITRTPFRISFFGGGTDFPDYYQRAENGGAVLSTTIDKYVYITCRKLMPYWSYKHQFQYGSAREEVNEIDEIRHPSIRETMRFFNLNYGLDMHYNTDIPARSGMGSSSAFTVGLLNALYGLNGRMANKRKLAVDAIHIERDMIGEVVGVQDQIAASFGGLNHVTFGKNGFFVHPVTITKERKKELESHLVLIFSGFQRFATDIEKEKVSNFAKKENSLRQMSEMVNDALEILTSDEDILNFGRLLNKAWELKKSLSDKVSTSSLDKLYERGLENGAVGGKILGAGGGGFMLFFCAPEKRAGLLESLKDYLNIPFNFEENGSQVVYYREE